MSNRNKEAGVFVVIVSATLLVIIAAAAYHIAVSNIYRRRLQLQTALDLGVYSAIQRSREFVGSAPDEQASEWARRIILDNAQTSGLDPTDIANTLQITRKGFGPGTTVVYPPLSGPRTSYGSLRSIFATANYGAETFILGRLPGYPAEVPVSTDAGGSTRRLRVVLVLDVSGSMGQCANRSEGDEFGAMINSSKEFIGNLKPGLDSLWIVKFGTFGKTLFTAEPIQSSGVSSIANARSILDSQRTLRYSDYSNETDACRPISSGGQKWFCDTEVGCNTNTQRGLSLAHENLNRAPNSEELNAVVLFTDGSPVSVASIAHEVAGDNAITRGETSYLPEVAGACKGSDPAEAQASSNPLHVYGDQFFDPYYSYPPTVANDWFYRAFTTEDSFNPVFYLNSIVWADRLRNQLGARLYSIGFGLAPSQFKNWPEVWSATAGTDPVRPQLHLFKTTAQCSGYDVPVTTDCVSDSEFLDCSPPPNFFGNPECRNGTHAQRRMCNPDSASCPLGAADPFQCLCMDDSNGHTPIRTNFLCRLSNASSDDINSPCYNPIDFPCVPPFNATLKGAMYRATSLDAIKTCFDSVAKQIFSILDR